MSVCVFRRSRWQQGLPGWSSVALALAACVLTPAFALAQGSAPFFVTGRNTNTTGPVPPGPNPAFEGDPDHKQQNEASFDVSPNNWLTVLGASNDYRGVGLFGDSWIGYTVSTNGGLTWKSRLLPGHPTAPAGIGAADPVVRTVPGLGLILYITLDRNNGRGTLSLAVMCERNQESGDPYSFLETRLVGNGTPGRFNDKPWMEAVLDPAGGSTTVCGQTVPKATLHVVYSLFPGNENNSSSTIYHLMSTDYGQTWANPTKLSESIGINQGAVVAVGGSNVVVTWRRVRDTNETDAIMFARSTNGGQTFSKAGVLWEGPAAAPGGLGNFFDQDTSSLQFRTRSMPSIVHDGRAFHAFWAARGFASGSTPADARIVASSSRDGKVWRAPVVVDNFSSIDTGGHAVRGHQIMPQAAVAGGRIQVNWVDTRKTDPDSFGPFIADVLLPDAANPQFVYRQTAQVFGAQAPRAAATGSPDLTFPTASSKPISRYRFGLAQSASGDVQYRQLEYSFVNARMFKRGDWPFHGDYHAIASQRYVPRVPTTTVPSAWEPNVAEVTSRAVFYSAFTDNRDVQGYVWASPFGTAYTSPSGTTQAESGAEDPTVCVPSGDTSPDTTSAGGEFDPTTGVFKGDLPRSRDQNIYAAATFPGLIVASPSGSKPTGSLERAYVIFVQNLTPQSRHYRFTVDSQPPDAPPTGTGRASFRPDDPDVLFDRCVDGPACTAIDVTIPPASSVTRTVYVRSTESRPRIVVNVTERGASGPVPNGQTGSVVINANPNAPDIERLGDLPDIKSFEFYQPDILARQSTVYYTSLVNPDITPVAIAPDVLNPRIEYPRIEYPRIEYPRIEYPRIEYPRIEYDAVGNPRIEYPRIEYPRIEYSSVENPRIEYSALTGDDVATEPVGVTEVTWPVTTDTEGGDAANTTTAMSAMVFVNGSLADLKGAQLIVSIPNFTTTTRTCDPNAPPVVMVENQVIVNNVVSLASLAPTLGGPNTVNPDVSQPSFFVRPGQVAYITLRLLGKADASLANRAGIIVRSQPDTTDVDAANDAMDGYIDTTAPNLDLGNVGVEAEVEGNTPGGANVELTVTASDDSGEVSVDCVRTGAGTPVSVAVDGSSVFIPLGTWQIECTAADAAGNETSGGFPLAVVDTTPPTLDVMALSVELTPTAGGATATYNPSAVTASDFVDTMPSVTCEPPPGSFFPLGAASITCTAEDDAGNSATATYRFAVADTAPPVLTVPGALTVEATGPAGAVATFSATASDTIDKTPTVSCEPASGSTFPMGATTVTCSATDDSGNVASASFTVNVVDTTPPALSVPASVTTEGTSATGATVVFAVNAVDLVSAATVSCLPPSGSTFGYGETTVTCSATDGAGNTASASFTVTVADTAAPTSIAAAVDPALLWPPNGAIIPVTVSGLALDAGSGVIRIDWRVRDEYRQYDYLHYPSTLSGSALTSSDGSFTFQVPLLADRRGNDKDGRHYTIEMTAVDRFGNILVLAQPLVVNVHDQSGS